MTPVERAAAVIAKTGLVSALGQRIIAQALSDAGMLAEGWRPIETAPKDGTVIHVWAPGYEWPEAVLYEEYPPADAEEVGSPGYWRYAEEMMAEVCDGAGEEEWTHWRPLPTPPAEE